MMTFLRTGFQLLVVIVGIVFVVVVPGCYAAPRGLSIQQHQQQQSHQQQQQRFASHSHSNSHNNSQSRRYLMQDVVVTVAPTVAPPLATVAPSSATVAPTVVVAAAGGGVVVDALPTIEIPACVKRIRTADINQDEILQPMEYMELLDFLFKSNDGDTTTTTTTMTMTFSSMSFLELPQILQMNYNTLMMMSVDANVDDVDDVEGGILVTGVTQAEDSITKKQQEFLLKVCTDTIEALYPEESLPTTTTATPTDGIIIIMTNQPSFAPVLTTTTTSPTIVVLVESEAPVTVIPETNSPFGALISTTPTRAPSKTNAMTTTTPTTNQPSLSLVTTNTPSSVSSPATLYRVSLTSFSIAATNVQSLQQFQSTMSQYMLSAMMGQLSSSVVRLVDLEAAAVPTTRRRRRRRLQQQQEMMVVYSFTGSVLLMDKTRAMDVPLAQQRALEDLTAVQQAVDENSNIGTNVMISSVQLATTTDNNNNEPSSSSMNIILIAGCTAGGILLCIGIAVGFYVLSSSRVPKENEQPKDRQLRSSPKNHQAHDGVRGVGDYNNNEDDSIPPPPPMMEEDMESVAGYSLASAATPVRPMRTGRLIPDAESEDDNESTFSYDQVGFKDTATNLGYAIGQGDHNLDFEYGNFSSKASLSSAAAAPALSMPLIDNKDMDYDSDVPSDERNKKTDQDLTGFDVAKTEEEVVSPVTKKQEVLKGTIFGGSLKKKAAASTTKKSNVSQRIATETASNNNNNNNKRAPPTAEKETEELESLASFLKNRRDAKLASRKSSL